MPGPAHIDFGPHDRLPESLDLAVGETSRARIIGLYIEEAALDPWARALQWQSHARSRSGSQNFSVTIIGAGMGGLNAALQLKRAGIPFTVIEKNDGVGGTWHENRYPGRAGRYAEPLLHPPLRRRFPLSQSVLRRGRRTRNISTGSPTTSTCASTSSSTPKSAR